MDHEVICKNSDTDQIDAPHPENPRESPYLFTFGITHSIKGIDRAGGRSDFDDDPFGIVKCEEVDFPGADPYVAINYAESMISKEFRSKVFPYSTQRPAIV